MPFYTVKYFEWKEKMPSLEDELKESSFPEDWENAQSIISLAETGRDVTLRDDQLSPSWLIDAVKICRRRGGRFRLVDSGRIDSLHLEWILESGADLYTGDSVQRDVRELGSLVSACRRGGSILAYLQQSVIREETDQDPDMSGLINLGGSGAYLHVSNREDPRDFSVLSRLAHSCVQGASRLIYYHHGSLDEEILEIASSGAWVHVSDESIKGGEKELFLRQIVLAARKAGSNVVFTVENSVGLQLLWDLLKAGAHIRFQSARFDYTSPYRPIEQKARSQELDYRAFYLHPHFLP